MELCARCHKNPAVLYITKMEGNTTTSEGLCLACAKQLGIKPLNDMISNLGVSDDDIDNLNNQMSEFMENVGTDGMGDFSALMGGMQGMMGEDFSDENDEGGAATAPLEKMLGGKIVDIDIEANKANVLIDLFGQETNVELELTEFTKE